jgi:hypothetical protein
VTGRGLGGVRQSATAVTPYAFAAGVMLAASLGLAQITPRMTVNDGWGYDGVTYADMTFTFRGQSDGALLAERPHFAYRPLVPFIVAKSGVDDVKDAYLALNAGALVLSGPALLALLRAYRVRVALGLLAVVLWALLPAALRYALYYPVLVDGVGLFFMIAALAAAAWRRVAFFAVLLAVGVLVRENMVILVPVLWLRLLPRGAKHATALTALAAIPALITFFGVRLAPPIPPPVPFSAADEFRQNVRWLLENAADRAWRFAVAGPLTLGLIFLIPIVRPLGSLRFLRHHPEWIYYLVSTLALIVVAGGDYDRYFLYFAPALLLLTFVAHGDVWQSLPRVAVLTAAQLVMVRAGWPIDPSAQGYTSYNVATMTLAELRAALLIAALAFVPAALVLAWPLSRLVGGHRPIDGQYVGPRLTR